MLLSSEPNCFGQLASVHFGKVLPILWKQWHQTHLISYTPYHPSSNGEAENFVQTFSRRAKSEDLTQALAQFLLHYHTTSHETTENSNRQILRKHRRKRFQRWNWESSKWEIVPGWEIIWESQRWLPRMVIASTGSVSYRIQCHVQEHRRHVDQQRWESDEQKNFTVPVISG